MQFQSNDLIDCYIKHRSLVPILDKTLLGIPWLGTDLELEPYNCILSSDKILRLMLNSLNNKALHLGVLALLLRLDKPNPKHGAIMDVLSNNGITYNGLAYSIQYCRGLGIVRMLRSTPQVGRVQRKLYI